jgi:vancomycin resistance protein YoaR
LQGKIVNSRLILELYGQKDGRIASVTEPIITDRIPPPPPKYLPSYDMPLGMKKCTERAIYGMTANVVYSVTYPDGRIQKQDFESVYTPWAQVCLVGINTSAN